MLPVLHTLYSFVIAAQSQTGIPFKEVEEVDAGSYVKVMGALILLLIVFYAVIYCFKRFDLARFVRFPAVAEDDAIKVLYNKPITPRTRLIAVTYKDKQLLIAEHPSGVSLLDSQDKEISSSDED